MSSSRRSARHANRLPINYKDMNRKGKDISGKGGKTVVHDFVDADIPEDEELIYSGDESKQESSEDEKGQ